VRGVCGGGHSQLEDAGDEGVGPDLNLVGGEERAADVLGPRGAAAGVVAPIGTKPTESVWHRGGAGFGEGFRVKG
jgi:hypothetical protein